MADKKSGIQVFFKFGDYGYNDLVATCADDGACPVFNLLDACKTHYTTYRYIANKLRAVSVAALKEKDATKSMINLSEYLCKKCKNRIR